MLVNCKVQVLFEDSQLRLAIGYLAEVWTGQDGIERARVVNTFKDAENHFTGYCRDLCDVHLI